MCRAERVTSCSFYLEVALKLVRKMKTCVQPGYANFGPDGKHHKKRNPKKKKVNIQFMIIKCSRNFFRPNESYQDKLE